MTGYNLPPGCNVNDIPGNRPEDIRDEKFCSICNFFQKCEEDPVHPGCPLEKGTTRIRGGIWKGKESKTIRADIPGDFDDPEFPGNACRYILQEYPGWMIAGFVQIFEYWIDKKGGHHYHRFDCEMVQDPRFEYEKIELTEKPTWVINIDGKQYIPCVCVAPKRGRKDSNEK